MTNTVELLREAAAFINADEKTVGQLPVLWQNDPDAYVAHLHDRLIYAAYELEKQEPVVKVTDELLNFLFSVGHHGVPIGDEGQPYEIRGDDIAYAQNLYTELKGAAAGRGSRWIKN